MARTLTSMVLDLTLAEPRADDFGGLRWLGNREALHWARLSSGEPVVYDEDANEHYGDRVTLRPTSTFSGVYEEGDAGAAYFGTYLRTVPVAKQWAALELLYAEPTDTSVLFLLADAAGDEFRWTGAAWVAADPTVLADWNTEAELTAGFPSWTGTTVGVIFRLQTDDETVTPTIYGARAMVRAWLPSAEDDLIFRTLIPALSAIEVPVRLRVVADGTGAVDLSAMREYRLEDEDGGSVFTVVAVHNLTDDPGETTDLLSAWTPATSVATLTAAQDADDDLLIDALAVPIVARAASQDYVELAQVPALVIEGLSMPRQQFGATYTQHLVRDTTAGTARRIDPPEQFLATFSLRALAQYDVDLQRLIAEVSASAPSVQSEATGEWARLQRLGEWSESDGRPAGVPNATVGWQLSGVHVHRGADTEVPLVATVTPTVEEDLTR